MTAAEEHEALHLFPVYSALVEHYRPGHEIRTTDPADLVGILAQRSDLQNACLIVAHCEHITCALGRAADLVDEVRAMCEQGRRPRYLVEMGVDLHDVFGGGDDAR
jgi:hypothetical protein